MASLKGATDIFIGGKNRQMKFDFNALIELEEITGNPITDIFSEEKLKLGTVRAAIFCGLRTFDKRLNIEQVGDWLFEDKDQFENYAMLLVESLGASMKGMDSSEAGDEDPNAEAGAETTPATKASTGRSSKKQRRK